MAHIYGCLAKSKTFRIIDVKELLDNDTRKPVSNECVVNLLKCDSEKRPTSTEKYWFQDDHNKVHRVIIYDIAESLEELIKKINASKGKRIKFPGRKSIGDLVVQADDFFKVEEHRSCEEEKSKLEEARNRVKAGREDSIMKSTPGTSGSSSTTLKQTSNSEVKLKDQKDNGNPSSKMKTKIADIVSKERKPFKSNKLERKASDCGDVKKTHSVSKSSKNSSTSQTSKNKKKEEKNTRKENNSRSPSVGEADKSYSDASLKSADTDKDIHSDEIEKLANMSYDSSKSQTSEDKKNEEKNTRKENNSRSPSVREADKSYSDASLKSADKAKDDEIEELQSMSYGNAEIIESDREDFSHNNNNNDANLKVVPDSKKGDFMMNDDIPELSVSKEEVIINYKKRISSTPVKTSEGKRMKAECTNADCISAREALIEENKVLKKQVQDIEVQLEEKSKTKRIVLDLQTKLGTLCNALQNEDSPPVACSSKTGDKEQKKKKICPILLATRVDPEVSDDEAEVEIPEGQIYLGTWKGVKRYASKVQLARLDKICVYSKRLIEVILMVWGDEDPTTYSFRGCNDAGKIKHKVELYHTNAVHQLLKLLNWKKCHLKPMKINTKHVEPLCEEYVKRTLQKILVNDILKKAVQQKKDKLNDGKSSAEEKPNEEPERPTTPMVDEPLDQSSHSAMDESMEMPVHIC